MLVKEKINVDAHPRLAVSVLTCHFEDTGKGVSCCTGLPANTGGLVRGSKQDASPSAD